MLVFVVLTLELGQTVCTRKEIEREVVQRKSELLILVTKTWSFITMLPPLLVVLVAGIIGFTNGNCNI